MNVIIAGCGRVGATLAEQLCQEGHDITVIDKDYEQVSQIVNQADVRGITGNAASYATQMEADIDKADLMIAVTSADEINLLSCLIAKKAGNCQTIARVRNPIYHDEIRHIREELGLSMAITPERTAAKEVARLLRFPSAIEVDSFCKGQIELLKFKITAQSALCDCRIIDIVNRLRCDVLVCIIERGDEVIIPNGQMKIHAGDLISIVAPSTNVNRFFKAAGVVTNQVKNAMLIGGGRTSFYLAKLLLEMGIRVKIIEKDRQRCEDLSEQLPEAMIICGDGTDQSLLLEEGVARMESVAALTDIDEENVMLALYAKSISKGKMITRVNVDTYDAILNKLDIGSAIHPKAVTTESILQYVRAMQNTIGNNVETLYRLVNNRVEALEFRIREKSAVTDVPLKDLHTTEGLLLCAIRRGNRIIIPRGQDSIQLGDSVVVITTVLGLKDIGDILK